MCVGRVTLVRLYYKVDYYFKQKLTSLGSTAACFRVAVLGRLRVSSKISLNVVGILVLL